MTWQFSIDVGGTFTDCFSISPSGESRCIKVLSSGLFKGRVDSAVSATQIKDSRRLHEPDNLWSGSKITLLPESHSPQTAQIENSCGASGTLQLNRSITCLQDASREPVRYEISMGEPAPLVAIRHSLGPPRTHHHSVERAHQVLAAVGRPAQVDALVPDGVCLPVLATLKQPSSRDAILLRSSPSYIP